MQENSFELIFSESLGTLLVSVDHLGKRSAVAVLVLDDHMIVLGPR